jgi:hypothetical protein
MMNKEGKLEVTRMYKKSGKLEDEDSKEETIMVKNFETEPAEVGYLLSKTINLGNYESFKIGVEVKLPCYVEEVAEAQETAYQLAESELLARVREVEEVV